MVLYIAYYSSICTLGRFKLNEMSQNFMAGQHNDSIGTSSQCANFFLKLVENSGSWGLSKFM